MKTLYETLLEEGLVEPDVPAAPVKPRVPLTSKQFAELVVQSEEFRLYIIEGLNYRDLPAPIVLRLMDHAWGKPVEHIEVKDVTDPLENFSAEQCQERAMQLLEMARQLRDGHDESLVH